MKVAIIDSGIGGIDLVNKLIAKYPFHEYLYLIDNKNHPFGLKTYEEINKILKANLDYLNKLNAEVVIIYCNTLSLGLTQINNTYPFKIYDIYNYNLKLLSNLKTREVNIIATPLTIKLMGYNYLNSRKDIKYINGALLTYLIEHDLDIDREVKTLISLFNKEYPNVLLGCTHYSLIKDKFKKYAQKYNYLENSASLLNDLPLLNSKENLSLKIILTEENLNYPKIINKYLNYHDYQLIIKEQENENIIRY